MNPLNGPVEKRLVSFVHYSDSNDQMLENDAVLIRIGNLYVQYNRAKSYNVDTEMPNTVTITHAIADDDVSDRLAALLEGEIFEYLYSTSATSNSGNTNRYLVVQVCSAVQYDAAQMDYATIRVYFSDDDNIQVLSDCKTKFLTQNKTITPSDNPDSVKSPTISPAIATGSVLQPNDPILDRDDNENITNISSSDDNGRFEGIMYVTLSSAVGVILFAGIGYYYVTQHIREQQKIMALQEANKGKHPSKTMETKKIGTASSSSKNRNHLTDLDHSVTAEEDDDSDDALYVIYDAHLLEI